MSILQKLAQEVIPLSRRQNIVLLVIIACFFQFALFFAPVLAAEAINKVNVPLAEADFAISGSFMIKEPGMDTNAAKLALLVAQDIATSSIGIVDANQTIASSSKFKVIRTSTHTITAYNSEAGQTDDTPCITANGYDVCDNGIEDTIAANFLKFGTKVKIPELFGDRIFVVRDRMNKKHPNRVDVWMIEKHDAIQFGVKVAKIQVVEVIE